MATPLEFNDIDGDEDLAPFERLFRDLDDFNDLLDDGPTVNSVGENESEAFLQQIKVSLDKVNASAQGLTKEDVDTEFTDDESESNNGESERQGGGFFDAIGG